MTGDDDLQAIIDEMQSWLLTKDGDTGYCPGSPYYCEEGAYQASIQGAASTSSSSGGGGVGFSGSASGEIPLGNTLKASATASARLGGGAHVRPNGGEDYATLTAKYAEYLRRGWNYYSEKILTAYTAEHADVVIRRMKDGYEAPKVGFAIHPDKTKPSHVLVIFHKYPKRGKRAAAPSVGHGHAVGAPTVGTATRANATTTVRKRGVFAAIGRFFGRLFGRRADVTATATPRFA